MAWTRRSLGKTDHLDKNPSLYLSEAPLIKTLITYKLWALKISDRGLSEVMKLTGSKVRATSINNDFYIFPVVNFYKKGPSVITCQRTSGFWQKKQNIFTLIIGPSRNRMIGTYLTNHSKPLTRRRQLLATVAIFDFQYQKRTISVQIRSKLNKIKGSFFDFSTTFDFQALLWDTHMLWWSDKI